MTLKKKKSTLFYSLDSFIPRLWSLFSPSKIAARIPSTIIRFQSNRIEGKRVCVMCAYVCKSLGGVVSISLSTSLFKHVILPSKTKEFSFLWQPNLNSHYFIPFVIFSCYLFWNKMYGLGVLDLKSTCLVCMWSYIQFLTLQNKIQPQKFYLFI